MKAIGLFGTAALLLIALVTPAQAYDGLDLYDCIISAKDRVNSSGKRLTTARDILSQDRANYHKFGNRDAQDSGDGYFTTPERRLRWQKVQLRIDPALENQIISGGNVPIKVFILTEDLIQVRAGLLDPNVG